MSMASKNLQCIRSLQTVLCFFFLRDSSHLWLLPCCFDFDKPLDLASIAPTSTSEILWSLVALPLAFSWAYCHKGFKLFTLNDFTKYSWVTLESSTDTSFMLLGGIAALGIEVERKYFQCLFPKKVYGILGQKMLGV